MDEEAGIVLDARYEEYPDWQLNLAMLHATDQVEGVEKLSLEKDGKKYLRRLQKEIEKYLDQGKEESLTPHMLASNPINLKANPYIPYGNETIAKDKTFDPYMDTSFFSKFAKSAAEKVQRATLAKAAINTLSLLYTGLGMGIKKDDYVYKTRSGEQSNVQVEIARLKRLYVITLIQTLLRPLFENSPTLLDRYLQDELEAAAKSGISLGSKDYREKFVARIRDTVETASLTPQGIKTAVGV